MGSYTALTQGASQSSPHTAVPGNSSSSSSSSSMLGVRDTKVASGSDARLIAAELTIAHMHGQVDSRDIGIARPRLWAEVKNARALDVARHERACNDSATISQLHQSKDAHASAADAARQITELRIANDLLAAELRSMKEAHAMGQQTIAQLREQVDLRDRQLLQSNAAHASAEAQIAGMESVESLTIEMGIMNEAFEILEQTVEKLGDLAVKAEQKNAESAGRIEELTRQLHESNNAHATAERCDTRLAGRVATRDENNSHDGMELDDEDDDIEAEVKAKTTMMRAANKTGNGAGASGSSNRKPWTEAEKFMVHGHGHGHG
jgi:hypothetical protein